MIRLIAAIDSKRGIAKGGVQPWLIPDDERYFGEQTQQFGGMVLMGSKTFRTIGHPLQNRRNFVASQEATTYPGAEIVTNLDEFINNLEDDIWIIGGASIFDQTLKYADELYLTQIDANFGCDKFFPDFSHDFILFHEGDSLQQNGFTFKYNIYRRS